MKKNFILFFAVLMLIFITTACNEKPVVENNISESSQVQSSQIVEASTTDKTISPFLDEIKGNVKITASHLSNTKGIKVSAELIKQITDLLKNSSFEYLYDTYSIDFDKIDSTVAIEISNSDLNLESIYRIQIYQLASNSPIYASKMLISFFNFKNNNSTDFICDGEIYKSLISLINDKSYDYQIKIEGDYININTSYDFIDDLKFGTEVLEYEDVILCKINDSRYKNGTSFFEAFDVKSGNSLYNFWTGPEAQSSVTKDAVLKIEKVNYENFDYRMFTPHSIIYRNSKDKNAEYIYKLPANIKFDNNLSKSRSFFDADINKNRLVYCSKDGIYLSALDGSNAKLIFNNSDIPKLTEGLDLHGGDSLKGYYDSPRITKSGACAVVVIPNPDDNSEGLAKSVAEMKELNPRMNIEDIIIFFPADTPLLSVYNADSDNYANYCDLFSMYNFDKNYEYDLLRIDENKNILAINDSMITKINADTLEKQSTENGYFMATRTGKGYSYDYSNYVNYEKSQADNAAVFYALNYNANTKKQLIKVSGTPNIDMTSVTDTFALCIYSDSKSKGMFLVKYK